MPGSQLGVYRHCWGGASKAGGLPCQMSGPPAKHRGRIRVNALPGRSFQHPELIITTLTEHSLWLRSECLPPINAFDLPNNPMR